VIAALQGVVFYPVQGDTSANAKMVEDYKVWAYPTFVVLNSKGEIVHRTMGYGDAMAWNGWLEGIKADPISLAERQKRLEGGPNFADAVALGQAALSDKRCAEAERYFTQAVQLDPAAAQEANVPIYIVRAAFQGAQTGENTMAHAAEVTNALLQSPDAQPGQILEACERMLDAVEQVGPDVIGPILRLAYPRLTVVDDERYRDRIKSFLSEYALYVEENPEKAVQLKREAMPEGWEVEPDQLNEFAWWCYERRIGLEEAEALARKAVDLADPGSAQANILDTVAQIAYLRGDAAEAARLMQRAIEADPQNDYFKEQLQRFQGSGPSSTGTPAQAS